MGHIATMFGSTAKLVAALVQNEPAAVENEAQLMRELRFKLGDYASETRLLHFLRVSRGKIHWAVNSYLREALSKAPARQDREDFDYTHDASIMLRGESRANGGIQGHELQPMVVQEPLIPRGVGLPDSATPDSHAGQEAESWQGGMSSLTVSIVEEVLKHCDYHTVCLAAQTCKLFKQVSWAPLETLCALLKATLRLEQKAYLLATRKVE